ncbi:molybdenum cofactor guanylyltransferase [Chloroflexota bacterium]
MEVSQIIEVAAILLCGGKNLRLGRNKALEIVGGKSLIEGVLECLEPLASQILIVTSKEKRDLPITGNGKVVVDIYPNKGPLGGIYTGLVASRSLYNIVVACDMPFPNTELLRYMIGLSQDFDAVVPRPERGVVEPLHAIYSKNCLNKMEAHLQLNQLKVSLFLNVLRVRYVGSGECQKLDPQLLFRFNINYQKDLEQTLALVKDKVRYQKLNGLI